MKRTTSIRTIEILAAVLSAFGQSSNQAPAQPQANPKTAARGARGMGRGIGPGMGRRVGQAMKTGTCQWVIAGESGSQGAIMITGEGGFLLPRH